MKTKLIWEIAGDVCIAAAVITNLVLWLRTPEFFTIHFVITTALIGLFLKDIASYK